VGIDITSYIVSFILILPAITMHEAAHAYAAYLLGDPTAKQRGRVTLWPHKHIDVFGTLILPAILLLGGSRVVFGYAKPVPFNPSYFQDRRMGTLIPGIAGPAANLALAAVSGFAFRFVPWQGGVLGVVHNVGDALLYLCYINLVLLFFNLIPIPGLDGSRVVQRFLPPAARAWYASAERYMIIILFAVLWFLPGVVRTYFSLTVFPLTELFTGLQFG
jgi:Zn-dependent protease